MGSSRNRLQRFAAPIDDNALLHSCPDKARELGRAVGRAVTVTAGIPEGGAASSAGISAQQQSLRSGGSRIDGQAIGERNTLKVDTQFNV